nr:hypothetical transcript [Hymenolepis microstoma]
MSNGSHRALIQWVLLNALFLRVAAALIMAVGIAGIIGGAVLCRGNTIEIFRGESIQGVYAEMGVPVIIFSLFVFTVGISIAIVICVISRKFEPTYQTFYRRPEYV